MDCNGNKIMCDKCSQVCVTSEFGGGRFIQEYDETTDDIITTCEDCQTKDDFGDRMTNFMVKLINDLKLKQDKSKQYYKQTKIDMVIKYFNI